MPYRSPTQLAAYLTSEGETHGYYVVFHARPQVYGQLTHDALEFQCEEAGKAIAVYLVRMSV